MSQKKEKYARNLGRRMDNQEIAIGCVKHDVKYLEHVMYHVILPHQCDERKIKRLVSRLDAIEREQQRRQVSRERIALLSSIFAVCSVLIWLSLSIFGMV